MGGPERAPQAPPALRAPAEPWRSAGVVVDLPWPRRSVGLDSAPEPHRAVRRLARLWRAGGVRLGRRCRGTRRGPRAAPQAPALRAPAEPWRSAGVIVDLPLAATVRWSRWCP